MENERLNEISVLRKTRRMSSLFPPGIRSKYIFIPNKVVEAGNHIVQDLEQGTQVNVPPNIGLLHHYREKCIQNDQRCLKRPSEVDRTAHKFKEKLLKNIKATMLRLSKKCNLF